MSDLTTLIERAQDLAQDVGVALSDTQIAEAMRQALATYTRDKPRTVTEDFAGDGSAWQFELGSAFIVDQSSVVSVEYPTGQRPPCRLSANDWDVYIEIDGTAHLTLPHLTPSTGETVRVTYTGAHTIADLDEAAATTIQTLHLHGVVALITSFMLRQAANRMTHEMEAPLFQGDIRERGDKAKSAAARADELLAVYRNVVGVSDGPEAASVNVDWDTSFGGSGVEHLTHRSRWR